MLEKQLTAVSAAVVKLSKTSLEGAGSKDAAVAVAIAAVQESADDAIVATKEGTVATEKYVEEIVVKIATVEVALKELDDFVAETFSSLLGESFTDEVQAAVDAQSEAQVFFVLAHTQHPSLKTCFTLFFSGRVCPVGIGPFERPRQYGQAGRSGRCSCRTCRES